VSRPFVSRILVCVVVLAALVAGAWVLLSRQIEGQILAWTEMRRAEGYTVTWTKLDIGGFPFSFDLTLTEPRIARDGWSARGPRLLATLLPWRTDRIDLAAPSLAVTGLEAAASIQAVTAFVMIEGGNATQVTIDGDAAAVLLRDQNFGSAERVRFVIDRFSPANTDWQTESLVGKARLQRAQPAPDLASQLLFSDPFDLDLEGAIKGPITTLAGWRDAGGTADLTRLQLAWGPLKLDGNATLAIDAQMRPLGAGTAKLQGLSPVLDRLAAKGQIRAQEASIAKIVLGLVSQPTASGASEVTVPITAQDGKLFLGPVPVATLRPLAN
jgi:hypothetical protein